MQNVIGKSGLSAVKHLSRIRVGEPIVRRLVQRVLDFELHMRSELVRVKRLEASGTRFKDKRHVFAKKLAGAHQELGFVLFSHINTQVDTVKMFGDLLRDYAKEPQLVVPAVMLVLKEARVFEDAT